MSTSAVPQNVLLISENKLKNFTDIDANVTTAVLLPFVQVVQATRLEYIIGARYYRTLLQEVSGSTLTPINENFVNAFAAPMLVWCAYSEALPSIMMRIKNNGIVAAAPQTISIKEMQWMKEQAESRAQFFERRLIDEVIYNSNNYPEVYTTTTTQGLFPHLGKNYFSGVEYGLGRFDNGAIAQGMAKSGIGYYSDPTMWCAWGGGC
jgi:hypothetical protein